MAGLDITGDGRFRCDICSRICPAFYPNCPRCGSNTFVALQVEPHPPIVLTEDFFQNLLESPPDAVRMKIYEKRAKDLINSFARKGYLYNVQRKVLVYISTRLGFECSLVNSLLAAGNVTDMLRPHFVSGAPPNSTAYLLSCRPPGVTATQILNATPNPPRLITFVASILDSNNIPTLDTPLCCSICKLPQSVDEFGSGETSVAVRHDFRVLKPCYHIFHETCIRNWFQSERHDCPHCGYIVLTNDDDYNLWASLHNARLPVAGGEGTGLEV